MITARGFQTRYGRGLVADLLASLPPYAAVIHPEPWAVLEPRVQHRPSVLVPAGDLRRASLDRTTALIPPFVAAVVGIGGGSAMDGAKWLHSRLGLPLYQVPSLPSVDACFTRQTAVRSDGRVRYEGDAEPELVTVDFELIGAAPPSLVRGGIGDVLSCHTACWDWGHAAARGRNQALDPDALAAAAGYLDELEALAPLLPADEAIQRLMECLRDIGWRCHSLGHARFEEGSEHFFAYAFEEVTGRTIMHGELVTLGVLVMSALQGNDPERARRIATAAGTRTSLDALGVRWDEVEATLRRLPSYVRDEGLWYSVADDLVVDSSTLAIAREALLA